MTVRGDERPGPEAGGDPSLAADGWQRRFVAEGRRARELADLYARLGFEVRLDAPRSQDLEGGCEGCALIELLRFRVVYTRRPPPGE